MADDISKKITIVVEAETGELKKSITDINQTLDALLQRQKSLGDGSKDTTKALKDLATQITAVKAAMETHSKAIDENSKMLSTSRSGLQQNKDALDALLQKYRAISNEQGDNSRKAKELNTQIGILSNTITHQNAKLEESRKIFDRQKATTEALKTSFDKLKNVSGDFGPSLKEAAEGFDYLKTGLSAVKTGFTSINEAIKTSAFGLLMITLQSIVSYLTQTTEGNKILKGAISAVGIVVEKVNKLIHAFGAIMLNAFMHPVDTIKKIGAIIQQNIINRFKALGVILDGIIHLDFKKMADGAVQAATGITHATDKVTSLYTAVKSGAKDMANEVVNAYQNGYDHAGKHVADHEKTVKDSIDRQMGYYDGLSNKVKQVYKDQSSKGRHDNGPLNAAPGSPEYNTTTPQLSETVKGFGDAALNTESVTAVDKKIQQFKQIEDLAQQSAQKIETNALSTLSQSIQRQSAAKIAALEKDKNAELSNSSLTSAQKLAIQNKYKTQENAIKAKAFKQEQEASIAQAVINGALAITKVASQTGIGEALAIAPIIAQTAAEVAKIASQKAPAYAKGGLHYSSDGKGGLLPGFSKTDNTNAYLRSGEGIVVSEAMRVPWARNLVSAINVGFGGRDFSIANPGRGYAVGGIFTDGGDANRYYNQPVTDQKNLANTIAYQMINNFPPVYVDVKDVNNQQNILAQTINRVNL